MKIYYDTKQQTQQTLHATHAMTMFIPGLKERGMLLEDLTVSRFRRNRLRLSQSFLTQAGLSRRIT